MFSTFTPTRFRRRSSTFDCLAGSWPSLVGPSASLSPWSDRKSTRLNSSHQITPLSLHDALPISGASSSIAALKIAMGGFGVLAVVAVILGATTANVLNLYSNTISAKVLDVRLPRWQLAILGGALGFVVALVGYQNFTQNYANFLIVLDYWIMPWLAVVLLAFYVFKHREPMAFSGAPAWNRNGPIAFAIGLIVSIPFMSEKF